MSPPIIFWSWEALPSNSDEVQPLATQMLGDKEVTMFFNKTQNQLVFECDGYYGVLIKGDSDETVSGSSS